MNETTPIRAIVVDDNADLRKTTSSILKLLGHDVVGEAWDGVGAVTLVQREQPDVIVMDVSMPGMDGITAAKKIQTVQPTPIVLLTAHDTPTLAKRARDAGAGAYLIKPPDATALDRAITITMARFTEMCEINRLNHELHRANQELQKRTRQLQSAMQTLKTLSRLVPVCPQCGRKIQDDRGRWIDIQTYIVQHAATVPTTCPDCRAKKL